MADLTVRSSSSAADVAAERRRERLVSSERVSRPESAAVLEWRRGKGLLQVMRACRETPERAEVGDEGRGKRGGERGGESEGDGKKDRGLK
jgi:serine/threonine protein kinase HipA of HipAB toxin-antitoxin module